MMKCKNCGYEYQEGLFCPECGSPADIGEQNEDTSSASNEEVENLKVLRQQVELENKKLNELKEQRDSYKQKILERNNFKDDSIIVDGIIYDDLEKAELAKRELEEFENLKSSLRKCSNQFSRRKTMATHGFRPETPAVLSRMNMLIDKVNMPVPLNGKFMISAAILAVVSLVMFFGALVAMAIFELGTPIDSISKIFVLLGMGFGLTVPAALVWFVLECIILAEQKKNKNGYWNIKDV